MALSIALAGNPNSGKTTMFNFLTGSNQYVGNWPGVTVEKKEGVLKGYKDVTIQDLPGIYSLSPYTLEEVVARNYLINDYPAAIINIVDASNIERNLYLTTQLLELGIPTVIALNMIDLVRKNGDEINVAKLADELGCSVVETSALSGEGAMRAAEIAIARANEDKKILKISKKPIFSGYAEHAIAHIEDVIRDFADSGMTRWYAIKLFERDGKAMERLGLSDGVKDEIEKVISECEAMLEDDAESIIANDRYDYVTRLTAKCVVKKPRKNGLTASDRVDRIVTSRWLALPIFFAAMFIVYYISVASVGGAVTEFVGGTLFGDWISVPLSAWLENIGVAAWLVSLVTNGIIGGVGGVLSFVPQLVILFIMLSLLEECGYMARVAFIMDKIFRKFGLSGKSFIPMLVATGCAVPGIMASRTIESEKERRMTIITASFMPCSAKLPLIALITGAIFSDAWWLAPSTYLTGIIGILVSGLILKKTKMFSGESSPFVMELPAYHMPKLKSVIKSTFDRSWSFIKRAGTVILLASIAVWFLSGFGIENGALMMVDELDASILAYIGSFAAPIFAPLGFGIWQSAVASFMGLIAKEEIVGAMGVLFGSEGIGAIFTGLSAYSFLLFNLLCTPCFAAVGAIKREMASAKWTFFALGYQTAFAYVISMMIYQFGSLISGGAFGAGGAVAFICLASLLYMLFRKDKNAHSPLKQEPLGA